MAISNADGRMESIVFLGQHSLDPLSTVQLLASLALQVKGASFYPAVETLALSLPPDFHLGG